MTAAAATLWETPWPHIVEHYRCAQLFHWDYWAIEWCPLDWRRALLSCAREDNRVQAELIESDYYNRGQAHGGQQVDPATGRERGQGPRPRGRAVENPFHTASSIPMRDWTPDLFKGGSAR